jgi:D-glycero-alpha-D-manno-heptose-7-phosphate kinase
LGAFTEWLRLPLGKYDIAHYAYEIERFDLKMAGGKQDQYSATFGGVNFMEFFEDDKVIVNPLRIGDNILQEWAFNTILFNTNLLRKSSHIIEEQSENVKNKNTESLEAMHKVKQEAFRMKNSLLREELGDLGEALNTSWINKKKMARHISNEEIDNIYETAVSHGALGGKISGAGGGGFMFFYCPGNTRYQVSKALNELKIGRILPFEFSKKGMITWTVKEK